MWDWAAAGRAGSLLLILYAVLWPPAMLAWVWVSWEWGDTVRYWRGDETTDTLPRIKEVPKETVGWLRYLWLSIAAEPAAPRWWTSVTAVLGGTLLMIASAAPRRRDSPWWPWLAWLLVGLGLGAIGLDERFQLHEWLRILVVKPAGVATEVGWLNPGDIATLVYPLGLLLLWRILYRSMAGDPLSRGLLIATALLGILAIGIDVLDIDALDRFPGWVYGGVVEEIAEWEVVALMTVLAWRRLIAQIEASNVPRG